MFSVLVSNVVDPRFEPRSGKNKDYKKCVFVASVKHATLRNKRKRWSDTPTRGLFFQGVSNENSNWAC